MDWSSIPKQTLFRREGELGDCWRCCIAAVTGYKAEDVPHFLELAVFDGDDMYALTQDWLNERSMYLVRFEKFSFARRHDSDFEFPVLIASGPTPRSKKMYEGHAIVVDITSKMLYDPHPDETGLTAIIEYHMIGKI